MADHDRRQGGGGGGYNRKRRHRDDDYDHRGSQRRRHTVPVHLRIRKKMLGLAESPLQKWHEDAISIAQLVFENDDDSQIRESLVSLVSQILIEQPLKTPFVAAVVLILNTRKAEITADILGRVAGDVEAQIRAGQWREVKLNLKFLACLQSCLEGDGLFTVLDELLSRAVDLQTASSEDTIGTELVKIILLTIPYIMAAAPGQWQQKAAELMDKTEIIAGEPHALQALIDPYHPEEGVDESPTASLSLIGLLQKQLQAEAGRGWGLPCLPRPWKMPLEEVEQQTKLDEAPKHVLPTMAVPEHVVSGQRALFPEVYFSVYAGQDFESIPPVSNLAASLIRDALLDTINSLDFNRNVAARYLIDIDCYFANGTFVKRATPYDRLREVEPEKSTWKPEDVAVDTVFSQMFQLPAPEQKLVYYHAVLAEACKIAPAAIAPSLGRAIRFLYRNCGRLDLELQMRFLDWFSHHLSNFGFTWKWAEWVEDVDLPDLHPRKAFIRAAIDKEIRLSFAQRIKNTLPEPYQVLITPEQEKDVPDFKFSDDQTPFAAEGRELAGLLRKKAPDEEVQPVIERIHNLAIDSGLDPLVASTDVFTTAVLWVGSKSLSHVLATIERTKDRFLDAGGVSEAARTQVLEAVMAYWSAHPGVAICIVEKLLNYSILTPDIVIQWALINHAGAARGASLAQAHTFEMVYNTVSKVAGRLRQVVSTAVDARNKEQHPVNVDADSNAKSAADGDSAMANNGADAGVNADEAVHTAEAEAKAARSVFRLIEDTLVAWASGSKDEMLEAPTTMNDDGENGSSSAEKDAMIKRWGQRWLLVFRRRAAIEEAWVLDMNRKMARAAGERDLLRSTGSLEVNNHAWHIPNLLPCWIGDEKEAQTFGCIFLSGYLG